MNKLRTLMATATMLLMLGCASLGSAQTYPESTKFLKRSEPVLGLNEEELIQVLGTPTKVGKGKCAVPLRSGKNTIPIYGNGWLYEAQTSTSQASLFVCVLNRHAVAEDKSFGALEGPRAYRSTQTILDLDLIEKAFKGELDKNSREDRIRPPYSGPEYEI